MKKILPVLLGLFLFTAAGAQLKSRDTLVQRTFAALKNHDQEAFLGLFPSFAQVKEMLHNIAMSMADTAQRNEVLSQFAKLTEEDFRSKLKENFANTYRQLLKQTGKPGNGWSSARFDSASFTE